jgi:hypothetical protein
MSYKVDGWDFLSPSGLAMHILHSIEYNFDFM